MRINVMVNDELMARAMKLSGQKTKKATIEEALKVMISLLDQSSIRNLKGKLHWEGNLDEMREGTYLRRNNDAV